MARKAKPNKAVADALDLLADLFENGQLKAATDPADFILEVVDEIKRLRGLKEPKGVVVFPTEQLQEAVEAVLKAWKRDSMSWNFDPRWPLARAITDLKAILEGGKHG